MALKKPHLYSSVGGGLGDGFAGGKTPSKVYHGGGRGKGFPWHCQAAA